MKQRSILSSRKRHRLRGTTLIEVLAGLIILGTLLASVGIARARFLNQWAEADRRIRATKSVDGLLAGWLAGPPAAIPVHAEGALAAEPNLVWRTHVIRDPDAAALGASVVRLEVFDRRPLFSGDSGRGPVVSLEFLVHDSRNRSAATANTK